MNAKDVIKEVLLKKGTIKQVYWVACGGSLVDLYPAHYMLNEQSSLIESGWYTSKEFILSTPKKLGKDSLVIVCSHTGNTPESFDAALKSYEKGAEVIALTDAAGSKCDDERFISWVYPWGENVPTSQVPSGITLLLMAELLQASEGFALYEAIVEGVKKMDEVIFNARLKVNKGLGNDFANACGEHNFLYILGSGANYSQTYGFAICSLMEMQWQNCAYIHSAEYFHGPFEVCENGVFHFLQMGSGKCREMDERALSFLNTHTDSLLVLDALEYGMSDIEESVRDYLDPILFYAMNVELRAARGVKFDHNPDKRRYMGIEKY